MKKLIEDVKLVLKHNSRIIVNTDLNDVFVEAKGNGIYIKLDTRIYYVKRKI